MPPLTSATVGHSRSFKINLEYWYTILALFLLTGSLEPVFRVLGGSGGDSGTESNPAKLLAGVMIYAFAGLIALLDLPAVVRVLRQNPLVVLIALLPLASLLWSVDIVTSGKRAAAHALTILFCIYIAARVPPEELLRRLVLVFFIGGVASFAFGQNGQGISWAGIYGQKNELGRISAISIMVCGFLVPRSQLGNLLRWATFAVACVLVLLSQSRTNWLILGSTLLLLPIIAMLRVRRFPPWMKLMPALFVGVMVSIILLAAQDEILGALGRDATMSGRQTLWRGVIAITSRDYPILGAGYGAFFTPNGGAPALAPYLIYWGGIPDHAHSGYINTWCNLGIPGVVLLALLIILLGARLVERLNAEPKRKIWQCFVCLLFLFVINNFSESVAFKHSDIAWALTLIAYCYAGMAREAQPEQKLVVRASA